MKYTPVGVDIVGTKGQANAGALCQSIRHG